MPSKEEMLRMVDEFINKKLPHYHEVTSSASAKQIYSEEQLTQWMLYHQPAVASEEYVVDLNDPLRQRGILHVGFTKYHFMTESRNTLES